MAHSKLSLQSLKDRNPDLDWRSVEQGKVVTHDLSQDEVNSAALAVMVVVKLPAPMNDVLEQLKQAGASVRNIAVDIESQATIEQSFDAFSVDLEGNIDFDWFKHPKADGTFNASSAELKLLQSAARRVGESQPLTSRSMEPFNEAVRQILIGRLNEYMSKGLKGITPYDIKGKQIYPGDYLADSLQPLALMKKELPEFYQAFLNYPAAPSANYMQEFFVMTEREGDRPVTSLKHWMVEQQANFTLIAERKFYISHSLDAMNTLILALQEAEDTYLFMVNLTFTQKVTGIGSFIAHKVGRSKVKDNIVPIFDGLQQHFEP
jgi:hypothetical protein